MNASVALGAAAAVCSMASFVPQVVKMLRDGDTRGLSRRMYALTVAAFALWVCYGLSLAEWPIVVSNGVCLALSTAIMVQLMRKS